MTNAELISLSLRDAAAALRDGRVTSVALCSAFLERIQAVEPKVRALLAVSPESVLAQAAASDARRTAGAPLGEFDGIPITPPRPSPRLRRSPRSVPTPAAPSASPRPSAAWSA